jgi:hypothetical protein
MFPYRQMAEGVTLTHLALEAARTSRFLVPLPLGEGEGDTPPPVITSLTSLSEKERET